MSWFPGDKAYLSKNLYYKYVQTHQPSSQSKIEIFKNQYLQVQNFLNPGPYFCFILLCRSDYNILLRGESRKNPGSMRHSTGQ